MERNTFANQRSFAGEKKESMHRRCVDHDYTQSCIYLITMTTENREPLFGVIEGRPDAPTDSPDYPHIVPNALGQAVTDEWWGISSYYPQIEVVAFQLMPDHLHGILYVRAPLPCHLSRVLSGFKTGCNRALRSQIGRPPVPPVPLSVPPVPYVATQSQRNEKSSHPSHGQLFSPGFNDRILFRRGQLDRWKAYLRDNPRRLLLKREHPDLLRVRRDIVAAGISFSAIGNIELLSYPDLLQVQLSRSLTDDQIAERVAFFLDAARQGAVLVSPKISKAEKAVLNAAFKERLPLIVLQENGFTDLDKPKGALLVDACAEGRLLLLAPWPHHNERITITRAQCLALNEMARQLCAPPVS